MAEDLGKWGSWQDFVDVVTRNAPDNWSLSKSFREHPAKHSQLQVLDPLDADVAYTVDV